MAVPFKGSVCPVVAIINSSEETAETLRLVLEAEGYRPVVAYGIDFKRGRQDLREFFATHQPQVAVFDIALPYVENWQFCCDHLLNAQLLPSENIVLMTANKCILDVLVGPTSTIELIGRPFDLEAILQAVKRALAYDRVNGHTST